MSHSIFCFLFGRLGVFGAVLYFIFSSPINYRKKWPLKIVGRVGYAAEEHLVYIHMLFFLLYLRIYMATWAGIANHCHANDYFF